MLASRETRYVCQKGPIDSYVVLKKDLLVYAYRVNTCHPVASTPRRLALDLELLLELCHALDAERGIENNQVLAKVESADAEVEAAVKVGWC